MQSFVKKKRHLAKTGSQLISLGTKMSRHRQGAPSDLLWCKIRYVTHEGSQLRDRLFRCLYTMRTKGHYIVPLMETPVLRPMRKQWSLEATHASVRIPTVMAYLIFVTDGVRVNFFWPLKIFTDLTRKIGIFDRFYAKKWRFLQI